MLKAYEDSAVCAFLPFLAVPVWLVLSLSPVLAQEPDQDVPVNALGGPVHADLFTGTATTSIPITVPPGRQGLQPNLALVYSSAKGDGWVGRGWALEKGVIDRQTKPDLDYAGDDYVFRLSGINVDLVNVGNSTYRAKIEDGFTRVEKLTASDGKPYFKATDKTGTVFYFGQAANTRVADPSDATKIFRWCLDRVEDVHGNYMTLSYTGDQGQAYLKQIDYTGHDTTLPTTSVRFHLEARPDSFTVSTAGFPMTTAKRLKTIEVRAKNELVGAYKLTYASGGTPSHSRLTGVQHVGRDATVSATGTVTGGTTLPPVTLTYVKNTQEIVKTEVIEEYRGFFTAKAKETPVSSGVYGGWLRGLADVTGDGRADLLLRYASPSGGGIRVRTLRSDGDGTFTASALETPVASGTYGGSWWQSGLGDVTGNGRMDLVYTYAGSSGGITMRTLLSDGDGTFTAKAEETPVVSLTDYDGYLRGLADVTGDGRADFLMRISWVNPKSPSGGGIMVRTLVSDGDGTFTKSASELPAWGPYGGSGWQSRLGDVTGNGRMDLVYASAGSSGGITMRTLLSDGDGTFTAKAQETPVSSGAYGTSGWQRSLVDVTGDGRADLVFHYAGTSGGIKVRTLVADGDGTFTAKAQETPVASGNYGKWKRGLGDVNGDGRTDLVFLAAGLSGGLLVRVLLADGDGTFTAQPIETPVTTGTYVEWHGELADLNGDDRSDIVLHHAGTSGILTVQALLANATTTTTRTRTTTTTQVSYGPLESIANGLGGTTTLAYTPSSAYPDTTLPEPLATVSSITTNDGNGTVATTRYTYSGGYHHAEEDAFRGFHYAKVTGPAGPSGEQTITETWFHQGNETDVDQNDPSVAEGYLQGAPYRTTVTDAAGNLYTETTTTYTADADGQAPYYTPPASVVTKICDGNACGRTTRTDFTYDAYGNVTEEQQYGDTSTTTDDRTIVRTYAPNTTAWILSLPTQERIHAGLGPTGARLAQTDFYYDGTSSCAVASTTQQPTTGTLTRTVRWLSGATTPPETRAAYDARGNVICTRDAAGHTTTMGYDASGTFVTTVTNPQGHVTRTTYYGVDGVWPIDGAYGQVASVTDPNGATVRTVYDAVGRVSQVTQPDGAWTTTRYEALGTVGSQHVRTDSQSGLSTWTYVDGLGRPIKTQGTGPDGRTTVTETEYDVRGAMTRTSVPRFVSEGSTPTDGSTTPATDESTEPTVPTDQWTRWEYDVLGRVTRTTHPDGSQTQACYDDGVMVTLDANQHKTRTTRDADGQVLTVDEYTGTHATCSPADGTPYATTTYTYDPLGNLVTVTDALGNRTTLQYDTLSRKIQMQDPDLGTWTYAYDAQGNLVQQTDAKGQTVHLQYDSLHRRIQKDYETQKAIGQGDVVYTYDGPTHHRIGRLAGVHDASGTTAFSYDRMGRVIRTDKVVADEDSGTSPSESGASTGAVADGDPGESPPESETGVATEEEATEVTYTTQTEYDGLGRVTSLSYPTPFLAPEQKPTGEAAVVQAAGVGVWEVNERAPTGLAWHAGTLYLVGDDTDALYTLDVTTGQPTRVGTVEQFGVGETQPTGLASHAGTLYLLGNGHQALYTLDVTTGAATWVGPVVVAGVEAWSPDGLVSHAGALYLVGGSGGSVALYRLEVTTGQVTRVGTATQFGVAEGHPAGLASQGGTLYLLGATEVALYALDVTTGVATPVVQAPGLGVGAVRPRGLAAQGGRLYLLGGRGTTALYTVDVSTWATTRVDQVETFVAFGVTEGAPEGVVWHEGTLYLVGRDTAALYTVDPSTGLATRVGTAHQFGVSEGSPTGLASHEGTLYLVGTGTDALYTVDPATGEATRVGSAYRFGVGETQPSGLASHQGTLYMVGEDVTTTAQSSLNSGDYPGYSGSNGSSQGPDVEAQFGYSGGEPSLYTLDVTTGEATRIGAAQQPTQFGVGEGVPTDLAAQDGMLYMVGDGKDALYTLDGLTGAATRVVQDPAVAQFGVNEGTPDGLAWHDGTLYLVGQATDALYTLDPETGQATRVGSATRFGVSEGQPSGLASHGGTLYLVGYDTKALYTLDVSTGVATRVGSATQFGVGVQWPEGLASHGSTLYMVVDGTPDALYTVDVTTGVATRVGTGLGVTTGYPLGLVSHSGMLYLVGAETDALYTVDATTGTATRVGSAQQFGVSEGSPSGLASHGGTLYLVGQGTDALYTVDATTGSATRVGGTPLDVAEGTPTGLAWQDGTLYLVGSDTAALYTLDVTTGDATRVGNASEFGVNEGTPDGLASQNGRLYLVGADTDALYTLNPATGVAMRVPVQQFGVGEGHPSGLISQDGTLYLVGSDTDALYTVETTTGAATRVGTAPQFGVSEGLPSGLAAQNGTLYLVGDETDALYTLDPTTGLAMRVQPARVFIREEEPAGLAEQNGTLYFVEGSTDALYTLEASTGLATRVGTALAFGVGETEPSGIVSQNDTLYLVGAATAALYTLDPSTGEATRVGTATQFGVGEAAPSGLAEQNGTLYLVGRGTDALYTLDPTTGEATRVGTTTQFGVGETDPSGLVSQDGTLYLVGWGTSALYTVDPTTGQATRVGSATQFGVGEAYPEGLAMQNGTLYLVGYGTNALYTLNASTGVATRVQPAPQFGVNEGIPDGMTWHDGALYLVGQDTDALYTLDPRTGQATRVGTAQQFGVGQNSPSGLASHDGTLYLVGYGPKAVYTLDVTTGVATPVGTGLGVSSYPEGLASHGGTLYMIGESSTTDALYTVDVTTGTATPVGTGLGVTTGYPLGLISQNGTLYLVGSNPDALYTVDVTTGTATRVDSATGFGVSEGRPSGLTSQNGMLYLVGADTDALYTLDPITGEATRVRPPPLFGSEVEPAGVAVRNDTLYLVEASTDALYTLEATTGVATRVGTAHQFGVGEGIPAGLAAHNGTLYLVGSDTDALYSLDPTTGVATRVGTTEVAAATEVGTQVGTVEAFGVGERAPAGLTSHNGTLYLLGGGGSVLYTLDSTTGVATLVGQTDAVGQGLASHHGALYLVSRTSAGVGLFTLDVTTGAATPVGPVLTFGGQEWGPAGLVSYGGRLAIVDAAAKALYTVDASTGTGIRVSAAPAVTLGEEEAEPDGLAAHDGTLYLVGAGTDALYTVEATTGVATRVGSAEQFGVQEGAPSGLASHDGTLYLVGSDTDALYALDPTTGVATRVGTAQQFGVSEGSPSGLASHEGTLYLVGQDTDALYTLDPITGVATPVGTAEQFGVQEGSPTGLASKGRRLYLVGAETDALYLLNVTIGEATRVGTAEAFGISEGSPSALATQDGTLYLKGRDFASVLYTLKEELAPVMDTVTYTYNGPHLASVQSETTTYAAYSGYNALGQPGTLTLGNGTTTTYTYAAGNARLKTLQTVQGSTVLQDLGYTFDAGGNVTAITDPRHGDQTFGYDALDRLTSATNEAPDGYGTITYTYNQIGNLLTNSQVGTYTYNASGTGSTRPHAVTSTSLTTGTETTTNTYSYDANGNLILGGGRIITWDVENRPAQMIKGDLTTRFVYDGSGGRVKKIVGPTQVDNLTGDETTDETTPGGTTVETTTTVYIGQLYVCEGTTCAKVIYAGDQRVALVQQASGATSYFHGDHLDSTSVLTDETGVEEEHNSYQPFGQVQTHTGTSDVAYKYTGQERDASTGLYFYQARYYDPVLGRFLSPDSYVQNPLDPQTLNRYAYVRNNPLKYTDPSGHFLNKIGKFFKRLFHPVNKFINRALGKYAPFVMATIGIASGGAAFGVVSGIAKGAFFKAATVGLTSQAAIGAKIVAMSPFAGLVGSTAGGLAAGFVGGFIGSGGDLDSGLIGAAGGGLGGLASGLGAMAGAHVGDVTGSVVRVIGRGVAGGTTSALRGGKFELGFAFSAGSALINSVYRGITKFPGINPGPGGAAQIKEEGGPDAIWGANNVGNSVYPLEKAGLLSEGSLFSRIMNQIPYVNAMAGLHDFITNDHYLGKTLFTNKPTMLPAYALTVAGSLDQVWVGGANRSLSPLLLNHINFK